MVLFAALHYPKNRIYILDNNKKAVLHSVRCRGLFVCFLYFVFVLFFSTSAAIASVLELVVRPQIMTGEPELPNCDWKLRSSCEVSLKQMSFLLASSAWKNEYGAKADRVIVRFLSDKYSIDKPIRFNWGDGATSGVPLEIIGMGASTVLSGAMPIKAWMRPSASILSDVNIPQASEIFVADVSAFPLPLKDPVPVRGFGLPIRPVAAALYQNDRALPLARWPNEGYARLERPDDLISGDRHIFRVAGRTGQEWRNDSDLMAHAFWFHDWAAQTYHVTVGEDGRLAIAGDGSPYGIRNGQRLQIENALSELDSPGEWYLQRSTGKLFVWLEDRKSPVEIAVAESIFQIENSRNIIVRNLAIEKVRGDAVSILGGDNIVLENVSIRHTGNRALVIKGGRRNGIRDSFVEHNGEGGVLLVGGDRAKLIPAEHFVENSTIRDFSRLSKTYRFAVEIDGVGQRIVGNVISESPHAAISFLGNDHKILNNEIFSVVKETSDAGAIYVGRDYTSRGTLIEGNFLHDIVANKSDFEVKGIYLDDQASGIIVRNNIFSRVQQPVFIGGGRDNFVINNVFYNSTPAVHLDARGLGWQRKVTLDPNYTFHQRLNLMPIDSFLWRSRYPNLANIRDDDFGAPKYNFACGNVVVGGEPYRIYKEATAGIRLGSVYVSDESIFINPLTASGRVLKIDFDLDPVKYRGCYFDGFLLSN